MTSLDEKQLRVLQDLYSAYKTALASGRRDESRSLVLLSLDVTDNKRRDSLRQASLKSSDIDMSALLYLKEEGYLREIDRPGEYTITAKAIWEIECANHLTSEQNLIAGIDSKYFDLFDSHQELSDRERVILLTMSGLRAFSINHAIDLKQRSTLIEEGWKEALMESAKFLASNKIVSQQCLKDLFSVNTADKPLHNLIRHTEPLPSKTRGIFRAPGGQRYFLDVIQNESIKEDRLGYVFGIVLRGHLSVELIEETQSFCRTLCEKYSTLVFPGSGGGTDYSHPRFTKGVDTSVQRAVSFSS